VLREPKIGYADQRTNGKRRDLAAEVHRGQKNEEAEQADPKKKIEHVRQG
jgi:hypothetical protein